MPVSCSVTVALRKVLTLGLVGLLATAGFAQEAAKPASQAVPVSDALVPMPQAPRPQGDAYKLYSDQNYTKGQSQFPRFWSVWGVRYVPQANFTNTPLIDRVIRDGKMYLSLSDAVALALENNLDIAIQRYNLITADVDILRTSSGSASLGVNTGLVQGALRTLSNRDLQVLSAALPVLDRLIAAINEQSDPSDQPGDGAAAASA